MDNYFKPAKVGEYYHRAFSPLGDINRGYLPKLNADGNWEMVREDVRSEMSWGGKNISQQGMKYSYTDDQLQRIKDYNDALPQIQYQQQQADKTPSAPPSKGDGGSIDRIPPQGGGDGSGGAGGSGNILPGPIITPKGDNSVLTSTPQGGQSGKKGGSLSSNILTATPQNQLGANAAEAQKKKNLLGA